MTSVDEFNEIFARFQRMYEECTQLLTIGIEQETNDEDLVNIIILC